MRCVTYIFVTSFETMISKIKFDLLFRVSLALLSMGTFLIRPVKSMDGNKNPDGLCLIFNPPIVKKVRASEEANFTVEFYCDQKHKESQIHCER